MSSKVLAVSALAGFTALFAANAFTKPSKTESIAAGMRNQLDEFNGAVHPLQNRR